jgi:nitroimidazol reductase NimA-like FMN-containing flavoprotein (pyridoxamine 5'-phosphate oxidase superfamily)
MRDEVASVIHHKLEEKENESPLEGVVFEKEKLLEQLKQFFESQPLAVLATQNTNAPYVSLVAFASNEKLTDLFFSTTKATRKYSNLIANPAVSLLIDNRKNKVEDFRDAMAVTAIGRAEPLHDHDRDAMEKVYLTKHPYLVDFLRSPTTAFFKVRIEKYIVVTHFQHVIEVIV